MPREILGSSFCAKCFIPGCGIKFEHLDSFCPPSSMITH
jgi:hypothetical protein